MEWPNKMMVRARWAFTCGVKSGTIKWKKNYFCFSFFLWGCFTLIDLIAKPPTSFSFDSFFSFNEITVTIERKQQTTSFRLINNELNLREHVITSHDFIHRRSYSFYYSFSAVGGRRKSLVGGRESSGREIQSKVRGQPSENLTLMTLENEQKFLVV